MDDIPKNANPLPRPVHGGIKPAELRALGLRPEDCLDFSASVSPLGPPDGVAEAIASVDLAAYPDPHYLALTEAIAKYHAADGVAVENVIVGNGSTEIIHLLTRAYIAVATLRTARARCPVADANLRRVRRRSSHLRRQGAYADRNAQRKRVHLGHHRRHRRNRRSPPGPAIRLQP